MTGRYTKVVGCCALIFIAGIAVGGGVGYKMVEKQKPTSSPNTVPVTHEQGRSASKGRDHTLGFWSGATLVRKLQLCKLPQPSATTMTAYETRRPPAIHLDLSCDEFMAFIATLPQ